MHSQGFEHLSRQKVRATLACLMSNVELPQRSEILQYIAREADICMQCRCRDGKMATTVIL